MKRKLRSHDNEYSKKCKKIKFHPLKDVCLSECAKGLIVYVYVVYTHTYNCILYVWCVYPVTCMYIHTPHTHTHTHTIQYLTGDKQCGRCSQRASVHYLEWLSPTLRMKVH